MIVVRHFNELHVETILVKHVARGSDRRQGKRLIYSTNRNVNWDFAFGLLDQRSIATSECARVYRRGRKVLRFEQCHVERKAGAARMAEQVKTVRIYRILGLEVGYQIVKK